MSRILKRPMFRRGGSPNQGIMTGLVDRKGYQENGFVTTVGQKAGALTPELEALLRQYTPKTRLPIGEFGLNLASGMSLTDALRDPYKRYTTADDAREAAIRGGAAKLAIAQAMKVPKDTRTSAQKDAEAKGLIPGTKPYNDYIDAATIKTEAFASGLQQEGQVVGGPARDKVVKDLSYVKNIRRQADLIRDKIKEDPTLTGGVGTLRRGGNQIGTLLKDLGFDIGKILPEGVTKDFIFDPDIPTIAALENTLAAGYAKVLYPGQKITNLQINQAKKIVNLTGLRGSEEVSNRIEQIAKEMDIFIRSNESLLGLREEENKIPKYGIVNGELKRID